MSYLDNFDEEPDMSEFEEDRDRDWAHYDDEPDESWLDGYTSTEGITINREARMSPEDKLEFISLLLSDDVGATTTVESFLESMRYEPPTEASHTLWHRAHPDSNGFHLYTVTHGLMTRELTVALDDFKEFTYSVKDDNTIVIMSPEDLWGIDVYVTTKGSAE